MKALSSLLLVLAICVATVIPSGAAADKQLTNVRGDVTYQLGTAAPQPVAPKVSVALANSATAITGANSQASITLPDSSVVTVGQSSRVQLAAFDLQPGITNANFVVVGKVRFNVAHPNGAKANYTFQTSTGQIAVRGTEGDISADNTQLQVNVYSLGDSTKPVEVTLNNGKKYTLNAGQALVVGVTGAVIAAAAVSSVTSSMTSTFAEFGPASNSVAAAGAVGAAGAAAGVAPAAIAAGAAAVVAGAVVAGSTHGGVTSHNATPTPTPTQNPTPTPGNVVVNPSTISLTKTGASTTFDATQKHGDDSFSAVSDNANAAAVKPLTSSKTFTVTAGPNGGTAHITVTGDGGKTAVVTVNAANGTITPSVGSVQITTIGQTAQFQVSEPGYTGAFFPSTSNAQVATATAGAASRASGSAGTTITVAAVGNGVAQIGVTDANGNAMSPPVNASVIGGPVKLSPGTLAFMKAFGERQSFTASETAFNGSFSASSSNGNVTVTPSSKSLFMVTSVANGSATITVKDGIGHQNIVMVTVSSPVPQPSTTCVPIIIHSRHEGSRGPESPATPCASAPPATTTTGTLKPHPVAGPSTNPARPQPRHTPGNPMHPMQPMTGPQGILTPPPLPIPPGGSPP